MGPGLAVEILLDTHIWVWLTLKPQKIGRRLMRQIENGSNELYLSPISIWEAKCLSTRSKGIRFDRPFHQWLERAMKTAPLMKAPLDFAVAAEAAVLVLPQPDPGDLFIAATAIVHGLTLATADEQLLACRAVKTIPND